MATSWRMQQQLHVYWADTSCAASITAPHGGCLLLQDRAQACHPASISCKAVLHHLPYTATPPAIHSHPPCCRNVAKHGRELARMQHPRHRELVRVVEAALAVMRLSCERYFVLLSVLATYLLFRDRVPRVARQLIRLNHQLCRLFQRVSARGSPMPRVCSEIPLRLAASSGLVVNVLAPAFLVRNPKIRFW